MSFTLESLQRPRTPEETLRYLADTRAIHDVLSLYCRAQDRCDRALLESVFHEDAFDLAYDWNIDAKSQELWSSGCFPRPVRP